MNAYDFNRMKIKKIKHYALHELLHGFFGELSELFDDVLKKAYLAKTKEIQLKKRFDDLEHKKINELLRIVMRLEYFKRKLKKH